MPFSIIEAKPYHCGQMARRFRPEHGAEVVKLGVSAHHELRKRFAESWFRRSWMIEGELVALGGVTGTPLSASGMVWLAMTPRATQYPQHAAKEARRQIVGLMEMKHELWTWLVPGDLPCTRFATLLGFTPTDTVLGVGHVGAGYWVIRRSASSD